MTINEDAAWSLECHQCCARACYPRSSISILVVSFHQERKLLASLPRRTSWNSRKQFVAHIPSLRQGMLWPSHGTDDLCDSTIEVLFPSSSSTFIFKFMFSAQCQCNFCLLLFIVRERWRLTHSGPLVHPSAKRYEAEDEAGDDAKCRRRSGDKADTTLQCHEEWTRVNCNDVEKLEFWLPHFTQDILKYRRAQPWSLSHWAKSYRLRTFEFEDPTSRRTAENFQPYRTFEDSTRILRHLRRVFNLPFPSKTRILEIWSTIH